VAHHVHRIARLGPWVLISEGWYDSLMLFVRWEGTMAHRFTGYFTTRQLNSTTAAPKAALMKSAIGEFERAMIVMR